MICGRREIDGSFSGRYEQLKWNRRVWAQDDVDCTDRIDRNGGDNRGLKIPED